MISACIATRRRRPVLRKYPIRFVNYADLKGLVDQKAIEFAAKKWADLTPSPPYYEVVTFRQFT
jgi:hypothetical protein